MNNESFSDIFPDIVRMIEKTSGQQFSISKDYYLEAKLRIVAKEWRIPSMQHMLQLLKSAPPSALLQDINEALCIHESLFFRDVNVFEFIKQSVLWPMSSKNRLIKIWSAGCSSGQEPYSYSFLCSDLRLPVHITATDFSRKILTKAQQGLYSTFEVQRGVEINKLTTYFSKADDDWQVKAEYKNCVTFQPLNLLSDFDRLDTFDIISCRNVLIYMNLQNREGILLRFDKKLKLGGYLILGITESIPESLKNKYKQESLCVFKKIS